MRRCVVAGAIAAAMAIVPMVAVAQNADPNAKATFVSSIHTRGDNATVSVTYQCAEGERLWVSAKQTASRRKDSVLKQEGSSRKSAGWLESHRNAFVCDGTSHYGTFKIDTVEKGSFGKLKRGYAWVQFCVTKGEQTLILSKSGWVPVVPI